MCKGVSVQGRVHMGACERSMSMGGECARDVSTRSDACARDACAQGLVQVCKGCECARGVKVASGKGGCACEGAVSVQGPWIQVNM